MKFDQDKTQWDLLPFDALEEVARVLMHGANKYGEDNWKDDAISPRRYINALFRHLVAYSQGEVTDPESGLSHMAHAACNALFLIHFQRGNYDD